MDENTNFINEEQTEKLTEVTNLSDFISGVHSWHVDNTNQLKHILQMPIDMFGVSVLEPDHPEADDQGFRTLTKFEEVVAFKHGINHALSIIEELPFKILPIDADGNVLPEYAKQEKVEPINEEENPS